MLDSRELQDKDDEEKPISEFDPRFLGQDGMPDYSKIAEYHQEIEKAREYEEGPELSPADVTLCRLASLIIYEASVGKASNYLAWPGGVSYDQVPYWRWEMYTRYWRAEEDTREEHRRK